MSVFCSVTASYVGSDGSLIEGGLVGAVRARSGGVASWIDGDRVIFTERARGYYRAVTWPEEGTYHIYADADGNPANAEFKEAINVSIGASLMLSLEEFVGTVVMNVDTINEATTNAGVTVEGVLLKDSDVAIPDDLTVDTINEYTAAAGVTVEGVLLKDSAINIPSGLTVDTIDEYSTGVGVTIETVLVKDGLVDGVDISAQDFHARSHDHSAVADGQAIVPNSVTSGIIRTAVAGERIDVMAAPQAITINRLYGGNLRASVDIGGTVAGTAQPGLSAGCVEQGGLVWLGIGVPGAWTEENLLTHEGISIQNAGGATPFACTMLAAAGNVSYVTAGTEAQVLTILSRVGIKGTFEARDTANNVIFSSGGGVNDTTWSKVGFECTLGTDIDEFSIDGTLGGNSDSAVPTEQAVKTYVDTHSGLPNAHHAQAHTHDTDTLQLDGVNSNGGAFSFDTTGIVTFNQNVTVPNLVTAGNVDGVDISAHAANVNAHHNEAHSHDLDELSDVTIAGPADDEVLAFNFATSLWINQTAAEAGLATAGHNHTLAGLTSQAHAELSDAPADAHHAQSHTGASHSDITSTGAAIDAAVTASHARSHDHSNASDSNRLDPAELGLPTAASASPAHGDAYFSHPNLYIYSASVPGWLSVTLS